MRHFRETAADYAQWLAGRVQVHRLDSQACLSTGTRGGLFLNLIGHGNASSRDRRGDGARVRDPVARGDRRCSCQGPVGVVGGLWWLRFDRLPECPLLVRRLLVASHRIRHRLHDRLLHDRLRQDRLLHDRLLDIWLHHRSQRIRLLRRLRRDRLKPLIGTRDRSGIVRRSEPGVRILLAGRLGWGELIGRRRKGRRLYRWRWRRCRRSRLAAGDRTCGRLSRRPGAGRRLAIRNGQEKSLPVGGPLVRDRHVPGLCGLRRLRLVGVLDVRARGATVVPDDRLLELVWLAGWPADCSISTATSKTLTVRETGSDVRGACPQLNRR